MELLTGIAVLLGFFTLTMLLVCMPVAICVFWWDAPLSLWNYGSVLAGGRVLASDVLLCVAFFGCYRAMFALRPKSPTLPQLVLIGRTIFGAWMLLNGLNYFFFSLWVVPTGHAPLAVELMGAFVHSGLLTFAMVAQLVAGAFVATRRLRARGAVRGDANLDLRPLLGAARAPAASRCCWRFWPLP